MQALVQFLDGIMPDGAALSLMLDLTLKTLCVIPAAVVIQWKLRQSSACVRHLAWLLTLALLLAAPAASQQLSIRPFVLLLNGSRSIATTDETRIGLPGESGNPGADVARAVVESRHVPIEQPPQQLKNKPQGQAPQWARPQAVTLEPGPEPQLVQTPPVQQLEAEPQQVVQAFEASRQGPDHSFALAEEPDATGVESGQVLLREDEPPAVSSIRRWELIAAGVWLSGCLFLAARILLARFVLRSMLKSARLVTDASVIRAADNVSAELGLRRQVALLESEWSSMPMTCGVFSPVVLLPSVSADWSDARLRMVLLHEMAHVRRRDCLWQWLSFVVTTFHWFNPLVWFVAARVRAEREQACDDIVLNGGVRGSDYAETLLEMSVGRGSRFNLCGGIAMARSHRLSARVEAIVDESRDRNVMSRRAGIAVILAAIVLVIPLSVLTRADVRVHRENPPRAEQSSDDSQPAQSVAPKPSRSDSENRPVKGRQQRKREQQQQRIQAPGPEDKPRTVESVFLPDGTILRGSEDRKGIVEAAVQLLASTTVETKYRGQAEESVTILFSPGRPIPFTFGGTGKGKPKTVFLRRMYIDMRNVYGPDSIVVQLGNDYRSFRKHGLAEWVAFRREFDRLTHRRPRPIVPATGEWSKPVNGIQARLSVENWRDPMIGVYLELRNRKNLANTLKVPLNAERIQFQLRGPDGRMISEAGLPRSGPVADQREYVLPFDSSLRFNLSVSGVGIPGNARVLIPVRNNAWIITSRNLGTHYLSASFKVDRVRGQNQTVWHGSLKVPPVEVRLASQKRPPDERVTRSYFVAPALRDSHLRSIISTFESDEEVACNAGEKRDEIRVTADESRHVHVGQMIDALRCGASTQAVDSRRVWLRNYRFKRNDFTFVRLKYETGSDQTRRGARWATDYPEADQAFSQRLSDWTTLDVDTTGKALSITDESLSQYPFAYMSEPGSLVLSEDEVAALREYLLSGGFLMADDFWGEAEWKNVRTQLKRVFPECEPVDLKVTHPLFHGVFSIRSRPQVCSIAVAMAGRAKDVTWERSDGRDVHYWGLTNRANGRLMAVLCHNTDLADGWERRADSAWYAEEFSEKRAFPMGINIVFHALTQ